MKIILDSWLVNDDIYHNLAALNIEEIFFIRIS